MAEPAPKPRRMRGDGSIYLHRPGLWRGELDLGYTAGIRKRKVVYGKSQDAVVKKLRAARKAAEAGDLNTAGILVKHWLTYWLEEIVAPRLKPKSTTTYRTYVNEYLIPALGDKRLDRLQPQHVRELHRYVLSRERDGKPLSSTTAAHAHTYLSIALNAAMREGKVIRNVASLVDPPGLAPSLRGALTASQARAVLTAAATDRLASRWLAAFLLGGRQGETIGLRWSHVDLDVGVVDLAWALQRIPYAHGCPPVDGKASCQHPKSAPSCPSRRLAVPRGFDYETLEANLCLVRPKTKGSTRVVPLAPPLYAALVVRRREQETEPNPHGLVWTREDGRPLDPKHDHDAWKTLLTAAEVPTVTLHETRHTTATLLLEAGVDQTIISQILGHSEIVTTRGYTHVSNDLARAALAKVADQLSLD